MAYRDLILAESSLVAYWDMQTLIAPVSLPNSLCLDSGPNGFHGSLIPGFGITQGIAGPILTETPSYGISGAVARIPSTGNATGLLNPLDDLTVECWTRHGSSDTSIIGGRTGTNASQGPYLSWGQAHTGQFVDNIYSQLVFGEPAPGTAYAELSCIIPPDGTWHHVAMTRRETEMLLFVDAWLVDSTPAVPTGPARNLALPWRLGYVSNPVFGAVWWSHGLAHYAVYNAKLSQSAFEQRVIAALGAPAPSPCPGATSASPTPSISHSASPSATPSASPSASPEPCTPPLGAAISCVNARGRLFVTLASDDFTSQIAYAWHEGAERMPITSMTNWKPSLRALTLQELNLAFETDNPDPDNPLIVSIVRNLRKNYVRDARVAAGSDRIDSLTAQFDADNIGDSIAVFGHNIGGEGVHFILGRIVGTASPSASPSPSSSLSASPSTTESASSSGSPSSSPSSSRSGSPSPSHSPSASPSSSPSRSQSVSPSVTPSASPSASPSSSTSASPSTS